MEIPAELKATQKFVPENGLPVASEIQPNPEIPTFIYSYYNLDPLWHDRINGRGQDASIGSTGFEIQEEE